MFGVNTRARRPSPMVEFVARFADAAGVAAAEAGPYEVAKAATEFVTIARRLSRINTRQCNGYQHWPTGAKHPEWDPVAAERDERDERRLNERAAELAADYDLVPVFQRDPRGAPLRLCRSAEEAKASTGGFFVPL